MGHCTYSPHAAVCSRWFGNYVAEKFSKEINGTSANLLVGLFEKKYIDTIEHYQQFHSITSSSCTQWAVKRHNLLNHVANKK